MRTTDLLFSLTPVLLGTTLLLVSRGEGEAAQEEVPRSARSCDLVAAPDTGPSSVSCSLTVPHFLAKFSRRFLRLLSSRLVRLSPEVERVSRSV